MATNNNAEAIVPRWGRGGRIPSPGPIDAGRIRIKPFKLLGFFLRLATTLLASRSSRSKNSLKASIDTRLRLDRQLHRRLYASEAATLGVPLCRHARAGLSRFSSRLRGSGMGQHRSCRICRVRSKTAAATARVRRDPVRGPKNGALGSRPGKLDQESANIDVLSRCRARPLLASCGCTSPRS